MKKENNKKHISRRGFLNRMASTITGFTIIQSHMGVNLEHKAHCNESKFESLNGRGFGKFNYLKYQSNLVYAVPITRSPKQHFSGYYTSDQFDITERYVLGLECDFIGRLQRAKDSAILGIIDLELGNKWHPIASTKTWNWQMGCQAEWLPGNDKKIIYNDRREGQFVSVVIDTTGREQLVLPNPIYEIAPDGKSALTLNFSRLWDVRPETGYAGIMDPWINQPAPVEDGVFSMDLDTGKTTLIISHADMAGFSQVVHMPKNSKRYFTHLLFNEDGSRFMFWYRCTSGNGGWQSAVYTASRDGKDIYFLTDKNSHCTWLGQDKVLAWATHNNMGPHTFVFTDQKEDFRIVGEETLNFNGHATFSPNKKWLITDIAPDDKYKRTLVLYNFAADRRIDIGCFHSMPELKNGELRCDLHPRWNRSGTKVCIDSTHEGSRQIYILDVSGIV